MRLFALLALLAFACTPKTEESGVPDDADGDGYAAADDCDDADAEVHPDATERCNDLDDDCDEAVDEDLDHTFYADADGDGHGDPDAVVTDCAQPTATVTNSTDCDDGAIAINPNAAETCDGVDNNCDGAIDEGVTGTLYVDADGDGHGDPAQPVSGCEGAAGLAVEGDDCDDTNAAIHPDIVESDCTDLNDYNCDGLSPYEDADGDGWTTCEDCDDENAEASPDATEVCNDIDDDCDDAIDEDGAEDGTIWYADSDGDGYGDAATTAEACDQPTGYVDVGGDCDDMNRSVNPDIPEICDRFDDDCDGLVDEGGVCG